MVVILDGTTIDVIEVPNNAFTPIDVILEGKFRVVNAVPSNAYSPIDVTLVGMVTDARFVL